MYLPFVWPIPLPPPLSPFVGDVNLDLTCLLSDPLWGGIMFNLGTGDVYRWALPGGKVLSVHSDGTSTIGLPDGSALRVVGDSVAVDSWALVEGNRIVGEVPNLPTYDADV